MQAIVRLVRLPNLLLLSLAQVLFFYGAILPHVTGEPTTGTAAANLLFALLVTGCMAVAGAGYVVNDCFDLEIDEVNRPARVVVGRAIPLRRAIAIYRCLFAAGVVLGFYVSASTGSWEIVLSVLLASLFLRFYSTTFRATPLVGNILVAGLTAWVLVMVYLFASAVYPDLLPGPGTIPDGRGPTPVARLTLLYAGLAFALCLAREVIKDVQDLEGDARHGRRTLPIEFGTRAARIFAAVWVGISIVILCGTLFYAGMLERWWAIGYSTVFVLMPLFVILRGLYAADESSDYKRLSSWLKLVMLAGILSTALLRLLPTG